LLVGLLSLSMVLGLRRWLPIVPGSLVAVLFGVAAVSVLGLANEGVAIVGDIDSGLPALGLPDVAPRDYLTLAGASVGVMLIGFAEGLGAAKTYAARSGYDIDANRELIGLGAADLGSGLASGMVVNGSLSKTAVNGGAGARSEVSGLDIPALARLYRVWSGRLGGIYGWAARADFLAALAALLGVLVFDTLPGLFIGSGVSLVLLVYRASIAPPQHPGQTRRRPRRLATDVGGLRPAPGRPAPSRRARRQGGVGPLLRQRGPCPRHGAVPARGRHAAGRPRRRDLAHHRRDRHRDAGPVRRMCSATEPSCASRTASVRPATFSAEQGRTPVSSTPFTAAWTTQLPASGVEPSHGTHEGGSTLPLGTPPVARAPV
jgi:hypothetical protein